MKNLHGMNILVTRPNPGGESLCQSIRAAGGQAIHFPTIEIVPVQPINLETDSFDWLIFISPQSVIHRPVFSKNTKIAAIGAGTAAMLKKFNLPVHAVPLTDWRTEGLLQLPEFQQLENKKIAIICGRGGRELLPDSLQARGANVTMVVTYERVLPKVSLSKCTELFQQPVFNTIVCTSVTGMRNLLTLAGDQICTILLVVVSERMRQEAKKLGFKKIGLAENASDDGIIKGILYAR